MEIEKGIKEQWVLLEKFGDSLDKESDRATLIVAAAVFEDQLGVILEKFLLTDGGPELMRELDSFSKRILAARALGLISKGIAQSLEIVRKMRNKAAHRPDEVRLSDPEFSDAIDELARQWERHLAGLGMDPGLSGKTQRRKFIHLAGPMWLSLQQYASGTDRRTVQVVGKVASLPGW